MAFYIIKQDQSIDGSVSIDSLPDHIDALEWMSGVEQGKQVSDPGPELVLDLSLESGDFRGDMVTGLSCLFHEVFKEALDGQGVDNIMYYPVRLRNQHTDTTEGGYYLANITSCLDCVDMEKSKTKKWVTGIGFDFLSMAIDASKTNGAKIFRLKDDPSKIIINQELYDHFAQTGELVGVDIMKTEDYSDW